MREAVKPGIPLTASRVSQEPMRRFRVFQEDTYISMDYGKFFGMVLKRNRLGLTIVAVARGEHIEPSPEADFRLQAEDILYVFTSNDKIYTARELLNGRAPDPRHDDGKQEAATADGV